MKHIKSNHKDTHGDDLEIFATLSTGTIDLFANEKGEGTTLITFNVEQAQQVVESMQRAINFLLGDE